MKKFSKDEFFDNAKDASSKTTKNIKRITKTVLDTANDFTDTINDKIKSDDNSKNDSEEETQDTSDKSKVKKASLDDLLKNAIDDYNQGFNEMNDLGMQLFVERKRSQDLLIHIENLINSIANHPKSFDADIKKIKSYREDFQRVCELSKKELEVAKKSALGISGGIAAGSAVASIAPTAVMWTATTFGTASTGTAISSLSGAAATNAALAWIGGGSLATGGGGISAGTTFLALAGPIGWSITGITIFASVVLFAKNKMKSKKERKEEIEKIKINTDVVNKSTVKINAILSETKMLRKSLMDQYNICLSSYEKSFMKISETNQVKLGALVNNTKALAMTLTNTL